MTIKNFYEDVLFDYENCLDLFIDHQSGAVYEPGRDDGTPKFLFSEVTGYAILDFILLHSITGNLEYLNKAIKSADWIRQQALDSCGGVRTRYYFHNDKNPELLATSFHGRKIFSFDTAICLKALAALFKITKERAYLDTAENMGEFLLEKMINQAGEVSAVYDATIDSVVNHDRNKWSKCFGAFHTKVAEALIDLHTITTNERYFHFAESICKNALMFQAPQGKFETSTGLTELHPHCYAAEGLLHVGLKTRNQVFVNSARRAIEWALQNCSNGEIAQSIDFKHGFPKARFRTDALAQTLALAADLFRIGELDGKYMVQMDELASKILEMKSGTERYFRYGYFEKEYRGKIESNTRSYWTNMFCFRGLLKYYISELLDRTYVMILAGGLGSRCWPISCESEPKPFTFSLLGDRSLLQETVRRCTHDNFLKPQQIFIVCSEKLIQEAYAQLRTENVPFENFIGEVEPRGTLPAIGLGIEKLKQTIHKKDDSYIVQSTADNIIAPYDFFHEALMSAIIVARENDCLVALGKSIENNNDLDQRFGHLQYKNKLNSYRCYQVDQAIGKPTNESLNNLKSLPGKLAWECGTLIFRQSYFERFFPNSDLKGNLAESIVLKTKEWASDNLNNNLKMAVTLLNAETRFEDFGIPGHNLQKFYKGDFRHDRGDQNICLGRNPDVEMLFCTNNLVISDELPIMIYGLNGYIVIDNAVTNTSVLMPLSAVDHLPDLYKLFGGSKKYEHFIIGGSVAFRAKPDTFVEDSHYVHAKSSFGLVFVYGCKEKISIHRTQEYLKIVNEECPILDPDDSKILLEKQKEDPRLVEHLIHVATLANFLVKDDIVLSSQARKLLDLLCFYHDIGGYLSEEKERREEEIVANFQEISQLDRRLLDSRITCEILRLNKGNLLPSDAALIELLNDNVNSAVEFLRKRKINDAEIRDLIVFLLQVQDTPSVYVLFKNHRGKKLFNRFESEIDKVFACLKISDIFANGRWLWKRKKYSTANLGYQGFLEFDKGALEDFPFLIALSIESLRKAEIDPLIYVNRLNKILIEDQSQFLQLVVKLQDNKPFLVCDEFYFHIIRHEISSEEQLQKILENGIIKVLSEDNEFFQVSQIFELPGNLEKIAQYCDVLSKETVSLADSLVKELYHKYWKDVKHYVSSEIVSRLI